MTSLSNRGRACSYTPIKRSDPPSDFYLEVRKTAVLTKAWRKVRANGFASACHQTRDEIRVFDAEAHRHIRRIASDLQKERFVFDPQFGVLQTRAGKKPRPIVVATVKNRIVQRAILDVLQTTDEIRRVLATSTSFGGIPGRGRQEALAATYEATQTGKTVFLRSDIRDFFTGIQRERIHEFVCGFVKDQRFLRLLRSATETELINIAQLRKEVNYFPIHEIGVAQGCALSPLIGNILLYEFDLALNGRGICCLRYIDDFLLLGPDRRSVLAAFDNARRLLHKLGLEAYDPREASNKAILGNVRDGFDFLGCNVRPGVVQPSRAARANLRLRIQDIVDAARRSMNTIVRGGRGSGLVQALAELDNVIEGWAHAHSFCNSPGLVADLDTWIGEQLAELDSAYHSRRRLAPVEVGRRLLGVQLLGDVPTDPIVRRRQAVSA
jgi:retron-type reverse transcriptase